MVKLILTRKHIPSGNMSIVSVRFVSSDKALAAIATWNTDLWEYVIVSVKPCYTGRDGYVASNGQLI